jgi:peptidoglycan/xylan/chitin deacetylase (PgdA/CDA1 family)
MGHVRHAANQLRPTPSLRRAPATRRSVAALSVAVLALALASCGGSKSGAASETGTVGSSAAPAGPALPGLVAQAAAVERLARGGRPIYCGAGKLPLVALTFDDGPGRYTPIAMRALREAGARATFFLLATSIARFRQLPRRERELGAIGDHTMTHPDLRTLSLAAAKAQIKGGRAAALRAAGGPIDLFRPPYGRHSPAIDREVAREGMAQILWDVDSTDSRKAPPARFGEIYARVRDRVRPGSIVLMHENRDQTILALRAILSALTRRHLRLVTVPELLADDPVELHRFAARLGIERRRFQHKPRRRPPPRHRRAPPARGDRSRSRRDQAARGGRADRAQARGCARRTGTGQAGLVVRPASPCMLGRSLRDWQGP